MASKAQRKRQTKRLRRVTKGHSSPRPVFALAKVTNLATGETTTLPVHSVKISERRSAVLTEAQPLESCTKERLLEIASERGVSAFKSWTKEKILSVLHSS